MRSNRELASAYLRDAEYSYEEALNAFNKGLYHRVIRRCQEAVELALKALLRYLGVEYPKSHDVSPLLYKIKDLLPDFIKDSLDFISHLSLELSMERGPSFYGDENKALPPARLYNKTYAESKLHDTRKLLDIIQKAIE